MPSNRSASSFSVAVSAIALLLVTSPLSAQTRSHQGNPEPVKPVATAGCSGATWSRMSTTAGAGFPVIEEVDGPADQSGLKAGDVILEVNGHEANTMDSWFSALPGAKVTIKVKREGKVKDIVVTAGRVIDLAEKFEMRCVSAQ